MLYLSSIFIYYHTEAIVCTLFFHYNVQTVLIQRNIVNSRIRSVEVIQTETQFPLL